MTAAQGVKSAVLVVVSQIVLSETVLNFLKVLIKVNIVELHYVNVLCLIPLDPTHASFVLII